VNPQVQSLATSDPEGHRQAVADHESESHASGPWRCFHCDACFTDKAEAELHFGRSEHDRPACQFDVEHIRWMEAQHRRNVDDDSEALRTVRSLAGVHETLRRRAEEEGYTKGLADAKKYPAELGLVAAPALPIQATAPASPPGWGPEEQDPETLQRMRETNTWHSFNEVVPILKAAQAGTWHWYENTRCKYIELRIDMRDLGCIIKDREGLRITLQTLAYQYSEREGAAPHPPGDTKL
jgi:hypothetical protein